MESSPLTQGVIHVHPSLRCNLACAHCYSTSSPQHAEHVEPAVLVEHLAAWKQSGYQVLSVSGGEPLLYPGLGPLAVGARAAGLKVHVITNGYAVSARQLANLGPLLDLVAVSIDGDERLHDEIRRAPGSFRRAVATLRKFRDAGSPVAVVSCVTRSSLSWVPDLADLCRTEGVSLLSLRPIVAVGRATESLADDAGLTAADLLRLKLVADLLDDPRGTRVRADVAFVGDLRRLVPDAYPFLRGTEQGSLADNVNPLVVTERGTVLPYVYGLDASYALGTITSSPADLRRAEAAWRPRVRALVESVIRGLPDEDEACVDWFAEILTHSRDLVPQP